MYVVLLTRRTPLSLLAHPTQGLIDCITLEALYDPVASPVCGHLFSRTSISAVLATQRLCPLDRSELLIRLLVPAQMSLKDKLDSLPVCCPTAARLPSRAQS